MVAIKIIDLKDFEDSSMQDLRKECAIMSTSKHANIVHEHVSFISNNHLWLVMEIIDAGSCIDVMQYSEEKTHESGIKDETVIATILNETIKGLQYLHKSNKIHRDVKAGNILLKMDG